MTFILYLHIVRLSDAYKDNAIFAMDEAPAVDFLWSSEVEPVANTTYNMVGCREIPIKSTDYEKPRLTVVPTARADGILAVLHVLMKRKFRFS